MKKSTTIIDAFLTFTATFLLSAIVFGYFVRGSLAITVSSVTVALAATFFTGKLSAVRRRPVKLRQKRKAILDKFLFSLPEYAYSFTLDAIRRKYEPTEADGLIIVGPTAFSVKITPDKISFATLASTYAAASALGCKRLVILSAFGAEAEAAEVCRLLKSPSAEIWDFDKAYDFFDNLGCPPTETLTFTTQKKKLGAVLCGALDKDNCRKYLFSAVITLLFARFMPYSVFYVVIASVSLAFAILSRIDIVKLLQAPKQKRI